MSHTYVIAELGSVAEGSLPTMLRQVEAAAQAGCDAVKAQWLSDPAELVKRRHAEDYTGAYQHIAYPIAWLDTLREAAKVGSMEFGCSVYLPQDVALVAPRVDFLKVASFEAESLPNERMRTPSVRRIVSLGMGAIRPRGSMECLHCVSAYPAPMEQLNLARIRAEGLDGFSDHTAQTLTGALAVYAGAKIVEFHLRLDDSNQQNPDYVCALTPGQARLYVALIRYAEAVLGDGRSAPQPCEQPMLRYRVQP